ncbi:CARDB domain-containing protein [Halorientalis pallida]|uniref:CARDB domain-containing protein n=1 Tax=Halorientalis pallida TaxID=2479928 RepID=UPI003C6FDA50
MGFDKGTIPNATVVTVSLLAVVGLLLAGATPAAAQSDDPGFAFDDDGGDFGFNSGDDDSDSPGFDFGGGDDAGEPGFSFGGGDDTGGPGFDFGGGDDAGEPGFDFGDGDDGPGFDFGDGDDSPGFDFGDDGDEPDFGGGDDGDDDQPNVTFVPTITGTNSPVTEGETLTVDATIENVGTGDGFQTVTLTVDGQVEDSTQFTLSGGESTDVTFEWQTTAGDAGDRTVSVNTATQDAQTTVTVDSAPSADPANFQVSNLQAPSDATVGDTITVSADVENTGDQQGTQTVAFGVDTDDDGTLETLASKDETLASGASTTVTFDVNTGALSAGTYTHGVSTANDTATAQITLTAPPVEQPPNFQVQTLDTNSPVTEGETLTVDATVANTGDREGTQTVTLSVLGTSADQQVTLAGGASQIVTLSVATETGDAGQYSASVTTENDTASTSVQVNAPDAPANFQLSGTNSNSPVNETETLDVTTTVQNTGQQQGSQTVTLDVAGAQRDSQTVQLAAGTSQDVTLSWTTQSGDAGDYTATVASANDTGTTSVTVNAESEPPAEPIPFTSYVRGDESYLHTGTPNNSRPITYPSCRDGQPQPAEQKPDYLPTPDCITVDGTLFPSNNTWEGDIDFPPARDSVNDTALGTIYFEANFTQVGEAGGTFNRDTGEITLNATIDIGVTIWNIDNAQVGWENRGDPVSQPSCTIPSVSISLSTEKSFQTGSPFPSTSTVSGERLDDNNVAKLVSDDFDVGSANGCGQVYGYISLDNQINAEQGIPAGPGDNEVAYDIEFNPESGN